MEAPFAVIGVGNPGPSYIRTRHNAGFWVVDRLAEELCPGEDILGKHFWTAKWNSLFRKVRIGSSEGVLVKPQGYMNRSGEVAQPLLGFFKISPESVIAVHDELDLSPGVLRVKFGGGAAGHKGISDLIQSLSTDGFFRVRVGIGRPGVVPGTNPQIDIKNWVLEPPGPKEKELLNDAVFKAATSIQVLVTEGLEAAQREFNSKI